MPRGGARPGAGRKKGSGNKRSRAIAMQAFKDGLSPLEVMLRAMREHAQAERWDAASGIAKDAAPYMHPRLASIAHSGGDGEGPVEFTFTVGTGDGETA